MELWLWTLVGIMAVCILALLVKIYFLKRAAREIEEAFADRLTTETNTLIDISSRDRSMRSLANAVNLQLRRLREERHCFLQGDLELKNAVTNIAHDLRTPLTAICGYLDLLEQEERPGKQEQYLGIIRSRTEVLTKLTEELFQYSIILSSEKKYETGEAVDLNQVLEESIAAFYAAFRERGIVPRIQMPEKRVVRMLDRPALARVFSNLFQNAIKYSDGDLEIVLTEAGEIRFVNTASGLNQVQVGRLFDRFYTVEAARKSTGLGLAIARTLIDQMNGTITADYENNQLRIRLSFPAEFPNR